MEVPRSLYDFSSVGLESVQSQTFPSWAMWCWSVHRRSLVALWLSLFRRYSYKMITKLHNCPSTCLAFYLISSSKMICPSPVSMPCNVWWPLASAEFLLWPYDPNIKDTVTRSGLSSGPATLRITFHVPVGVFCQYPGRGIEKKVCSRGSLLLNYQTKMHFFPYKMLFLRWLGKSEHEVCIRRWQGTN